MNQLAVLALGAAALLLHLLLSAVAAPLLSFRVEAASLARLRHSGTQWRTRLLKPFLDLRGLAAREPVRSEGASAVASVAPLLSLALSMAAAALVPSFATGMLDWPLADLLPVLALLSASQLVRLAAAADGGLAAPGLAAVGGTVDALLAVPALAVAVVVLVGQAGGTGLDLLLAAPHSFAVPGILSCAVALILAALAAGGRNDALCQALSGPDLAIARLETGLRRLVWIDLVGALAWPGSLAAAQSGPLDWIAALLGWSVRFVIGAMLLLAASAVVRTGADRRRLAALGLLAALLGPILLLAGQGVE